MLQFALSSPAVPSNGLGGNTYAAQLHNAKHATALEAEHARDLYLQGAMAVGQIARLLAELCADVEETQEHEGVIQQEEAEDTNCPRFVSHDERVRIEAWRDGIELSNGIIDLTQSPKVDCNGHSDILAVEEPNSTYLCGANVIGDIANLLENLVQGFDNDETCSEDACSFEDIATAQLPVPPHSSTSDTDSELASRLSGLSARLAKLETDIQEFSRERSDALTRLELEVAAEKNKGGYKFLHVFLDDDGPLPSNDLLDHCIVLELEAARILPVTRIWTTDSATSASSLATPIDDDVGVRRLDKQGYFWTSFFGRLL
ncbi:hypothetical protein K439DRAFT_1642360 [Ramaria rubella]|nr:hypothetical protein K439DRAFT_1642360 [Ramaria rubella]